MGTAFYRALIEGKARVAQIALPDARTHADIRAVQALIQASADAIA